MLVKMNLGVEVLESPKERVGRCRNVEFVSFQCCVPCLGSPLLEIAIRSNYSGKCSEMLWLTTVCQAHSCGKGKCGEKATKESQRQMLEAIDLNTTGSSRLATPKERMSTANI